MKYIVKVKPLDKPRTWELLEDFNYKGWVVPAGFQTDGASVPPLFWWFFPHGGAKFAAAVFHDWGYREQLITKEIADAAFLEIMVANGTPKKKACIMYYSVKIFGIIPWHRRKMYLRNI